MATLARSNDDLILDGIIAKLTAHRAADILVDPAYNFDLARDLTTPWQDLERPLVNVELETDSGESPEKFTAKFRALCLVPTTDDDALGVARLYVLKEQVRKALLDKSDRDFGQAVGVIGNPATLKLTWTRVQFDDEKFSEEILAGTWSFDITYGYEPKYPEGIALDSIKATLDGFSAVWTF